MNTYVLGHSDPEVQRLENQARFIGDLTDDILRRAGLAPGMRVLDLGCGTGDVSFLAASLVGAGGSVLGIDQAPGAIEKARGRATLAHLDQVRFEVGSVADYQIVEPVDAVVGRLILLHLPDPAATLQRLAAQTKPGTLFVFHEMDMSTARSMPEAPLCAQGMRWIYQTFRRAGVETDMGSKLYTTFRRAGLPDPQMLLSARFEAGPDSFAYQYLTEVLRTLLPLAERSGIASAAEVGIDTFADRLRNEVLALDGVLQPPAFIGAWARTRT
ncbi:class I SAM-dependent methyltransferase [Caballeronia insecticola]|uniref:Methylase involved in ubiquinone/menaquinone biosynthesis n=1 Tax=Caballeronia insecticola TaxID=758793 RepID=R4X1Q5_9BURK|nr:class I SAM-dependent methyltransferase [Caballeronia insecticola]BAN26241.1 methylase involved in ubiquinone/menaquinone biosynthesis [Caballeronia insecticola]